jgi:hypothetical protein
MLWHKAGRSTEARFLAPKLGPKRCILLNQPDCFDGGVSPYRSLDPQIDNSDAEWIELNIKDDKSSLVEICNLNA